MKIQDIIDRRIAVHCNTEQIAKEFLQACDNIGIVWSGDNSATKYTNFDVYKNDTCYIITSDGLLYCDKNYYKHIYYQIINFDELEPVTEFDNPEINNDLTSMENLKSNLKHQDILDNISSTLNSQQAIINELKELSEKQDRYIKHMKQLLHKLKDL